MDRYSALLKRINSGERILIDGATGTEIERRGVPQLDNAWNGGGALSHPDVLRSVHEDYLRLGAEVIISNNFATHYFALRDAGEENRFEVYNRRGVELAIEARNNVGKPDALVAGDGTLAGQDEVQILSGSQSARSENADAVLAFSRQGGADQATTNLPLDFTLLLLGNWL